MRRWTRSARAFAGCPSPWRTSWSTSRWARRCDRGAKLPPKQKRLGWGTRGVLARSRLGMQRVELLPQRIERNLNRRGCDHKALNWLPSALAAVIGFPAHRVDYPDVDDAHRAVIVQALLIAGNPVFGGKYLDYRDGRCSQDTLIGTIDRNDSEVSYTHTGR